MLRLQSRLGKQDLVRPGRDLVKEGQLEKISRKEIVSRYFVLLSDSLLYCYFSGPWVDQNTGLRVGYDIPIKGIRVMGPAPEDPHQQEFSVTNSVRSFIVRAKLVTFERSKH